MTISLDDYFVPTATTRRRTTRPTSTSLKDLDTIDLPLLNEHLARLLRGEDVELPPLDFNGDPRRQGVARAGSEQGRAGPRGHPRAEPAADARRARRDASSRSTSAR